MKRTMGGAWRGLFSGRACPGHGRRTAMGMLSTVGVGMVLLASGPAWGVNLSAPPSLKTIPVPEPNNLGLFLKSDPSNLNPDGFPIPTPDARNAAVALGKALFWDMQVGSDGVQACATCHFQAGADIRAKNQVSPGINASPPDNTFQATGPNGTLTVAHFPFHKLQGPDDRFSTVLFDTNDVVSSQGVHKTTFVGQPLAGAVEQGTPEPDPVFNVGTVNTRRVEPRNAPTVINAVFNFANFWDGRANFIFNGSSPFGDADPDAGVWVNVNGVLEKQRVRIPMGSLASQAVGPPGSPFEMSYAGRTFPDIGKKLLKLVPLGQQKVHPQDSVLGPLSKATVIPPPRTTGHGMMARRGRPPGLRLPPAPAPVVNLGGRPGLNTTYSAMIQAAFQDEYWNSTQPVQPLLPGRSDAFTQMEANFSLFFGLAVQLYEATLVSDDTPFDRFQEGDDAAMSLSAQMGLNIFLAPNGPAQVGGSCINCHSGAEFTNASFSRVGATNFGSSLPEGLVERMIMGDTGGAWYDDGYYNVGVRPTEEDSGRGGIDPFGFPLSFTDRALLVFNGTALPFETPPLPCGPGYPLVCPQDQRAATLGAFKTPTLRNVELTGPYMHNGGEATLMQVIDFYSRGGNFTERNIAMLDADIQVLIGINGSDYAQRQLIDFLLALTDARVRWERAPFDHPELLVPNGAPGNDQSASVCGGQSCDEMLRLPAVGAAGRAAQNLPSLKTFLGLDPYQP
jgi:cytochrome c peroxidase